MVFEALKFDVLENLKEINPLFSFGDGLKQTHFVMMADIINNALRNSPEITGDKFFNLGSTISPMTLRRFFKGRYTPETVSDQRFLKSVDKLAIFLGYKDFNHYCNTRKDQMPIQGADFDKFFINTIEAYCRAEFGAFRMLPVVDMSQAKEFLFSECPLRARIYTLLSRFSKLGLHMVTENTRSSYEIYDITVISRKVDTVACATKEFWNLLFQAGDGSEYTYHKLNDQIYFFKKEVNSWKLWDNYNPDSGNLMKQTDFSA